MEQRRMQRVLREQFGFRVFIFLVAFVGCVGYLLYNEQDTIIWGFVLGIAASALVWALVELVDFFVNTFQQYCLERSSFILMISGYWSQIRILLKQDRQTISWLPIKNIVEELYNQTAKYPFVGGIYSTSKEFQEATHYIFRLYWKVHGCFWNVDDLDPNSIPAEQLYEAFVQIEKSDGSADEFLIEFSTIEAEMKELEGMPVSFDSFEVPKHIFENRHKGTMWERFDLDENISTCWNFRPANDFQKKFGELPAHGSFLTVLSLIFRKISN